MILYALYDEYGEIRYVGQISKEGKTLEKRLEEHLWSSSLRKPGHKNHWLRSMLGRGQKPTARVFQRFNSKSELDGAEKYWISHLRSQGCRLVNDVAGGEGLCNPSPETRARMSAAKKGRPSWKKGTHLSEATKEKLRQANLGKKASVETRAKMAAVDRSSYTLTEGGRTRIKEARLGWRASPEQIENMKRAAQLREAKKRQSLAQKEQ